MRTTQEIYAGLKQSFFEQCGIAIADGGDMALRLMAVAAEIFSLEAQCAYTLRQAFPQNAAGEYLDKHARVRALERRKAAHAAGVLRFYADGAAATELNVPEGTQCLDADGQVFVTTQAAVIPKGGEYCDVPAKAAAAGENGNAPARSIVFIRLPPAGVVSVSNPEAFSGGSSDEDDDSLRQRVLASYRRLPNGANAAYYEALVLGVAGVEKVVVMPRVRGRGTVDIVFSATGGLPSQELLEQVRQLVQEQREICVDVEIRAPEAAQVDISAAISVDRDHDFETVSAEVKRVLEDYFGGHRLGEGIYTARILALIMSVEGVENCSLSAPAADIEPADTRLAVAGSISISEVA